MDNLRKQVGKQAIRRLTHNETHKSAGLNSNSYPSYSLPILKQRYFGVFADTLAAMFVGTAWKKLEEQCRWIMGYNSIAVYMCV